MHTRFPSSLKKLMCCTVYHWKCRAIKVGVFLEMLVKSPNRFLLNFTLALWTERTRAAHSPSYEADCNLLLYSRILCVHILKHPLWPGNTDHVPFYMGWIRPWKCSFHVLPNLRSPTQSGVFPTLIVFSTVYTSRILLSLMLKSWYTKLDDWLTLLLWD